MKKFIRVGFYKELLYGDPEGESLKDGVGKLSLDNIALIVSYLISGVPFAVASGVCRDVLSESRNIIGSISLQTDGEFSWPSDLAYYVEKYRVGLPAEFLNHMQAMEWSVPDVDVAKLIT